MKPGLLDVRLTGRARSFRQLQFRAVITLAAIAALGYVLPAHFDPRDAAYHSNFADGGPTSLVVLAGVATFAFALRRIELGGGLLTGIVAIGGAIGALAPVLLVHLFGDVQTNGIGESMFAAGLLGLIGVGATMLVSEPILYLVARRSLRTGTLPRALPGAPSSSSPHVDATP